MAAPFMFGAVPFLRARWLKMSDETAMRYVVEWMDDKKKEEESASNT